MSERKPGTSGHAPLTADPNELSARRAGRGRGRKAADGGRGGPGDIPPGGGAGGAGSAGGRGAGRSWFLNLVVALLVLGLAGAGWLLVEQHQQLEAAQQSLQDADERLLQLESRLQMTDEALGEAGTEVQDQLRFWESEIRKLWDVSNQRNRGWIEDNRAAIARHNEQINEMSGRLEAVRNQASSHEQALAEYRQVADNLSNMEAQQRSLLEQQRELREQVASARQALARLESGLVRRVDRHDEAIDAIDAYRMQINARLSDLTNRVDQLGRGGSGG
jgi:hypothetical protein